VENNVLIQFGSRIKFLRNQAGLSQEKLAELTGFHRTYIGLVENGKRNVSLKNIEVFAKCFKIQISDLFIK
jgi:transcriptional regulator with XRE-family HTH domain